MDTFALFVFRQKWNEIKFGDIYLWLYGPRSGALSQTLMRNIRGLYGISGNPLELERITGHLNHNIKFYRVIKNSKE